MEDLQPDLWLLANQRPKLPSVSEGSTSSESTPTPPRMIFQKCPCNNPCQIIVSKAYAIYRLARLLSVPLAQHPARAVYLQLAAKTSPKSDFQDEHGWSYPIGKSGDGRSYSCRRLFFWHARSRASPLLGPCESRGRRDCNTGKYARSWRSQSEG